MPEFKKEEKEAVAKKQFRRGFVAEIQRNLTHFW